MPDTWVGDAGGSRKKLSDIWVGTSTQKQKLQKLWVGDNAGNPKLIYQKIPELKLTAAASSPSQVNLAWTNLGPGWTYALQTSIGWAWQTPATATSWSHTGLAASTYYAYRVDAYYGGEKLVEAHASATTMAPSYQQKHVVLRAVSSATYNGANANRGVAECYYGWYSSTNGIQKSLWCFDIPTDLRGCVSIDRIDFAIWNQHHFMNSGGSASVVVHHGDFRGGMPATYPGATTPLLYQGNAWNPGAPKPGWMTPNTDGWITNVHVLAASGRASLGEEFRSVGAWGLGLVASVAGNNQNGYGYAQGATQAEYPRISIWYTVRVAKDE